jgi:hypothetical protein
MFFMYFIGIQFYYFTSSAWNITPPTQKATLHIDPTEVVKYLTMFLFYKDCQMLREIFHFMCFIW